MKKIVLTIIAGLTFFAQTKAQSIKGNVVDENGNPMEFATVAILSDSLIISGGITDLDGTFDISMPQGANLVQISMMGYRMEELPVSAFPCTVQLQPDNVMLQGVEITAQLPKTEIKGDAVVTNITGSVLEHSGNANDVMAKVPGMISTKDGLEVLGRGKPEYYINGRKVTDDSELRNLMSEDIKSIDVVSNPGALYGGEVRCVVRIRTVKRQGEGFSYALTSQAKQHIYDCNDFEPSWSVLDLNYRTGGLDLFGKIVYWNQRTYQVSELYNGTNTLVNGVPTSHFEKGTIDNVSHFGGMQYVFGANWQIDDNHSLGFKINRDHNYIGSSDTRFITDVLVNDTIVDNLNSLSCSSFPQNTQWNGNLYYDGNIDKLNINFNADFIDGHQKKNTGTQEISWSSPVEISSSSKSRITMGAGKLVLSYPIGKGMLQAGSEETYVVASETYNISKSDIPSSDASLKENTIAGFAQYALSLPFGQMSAGLRYEHVDMSYDDFLNRDNSIERHQDNWFPSFSFASAFGPVNYSLSYTGKTVRPSYDMLSNQVQYNNRYSYQSGDPKLMNEKHNTLSLNANWKWLTFTTNYEVVEHRHVQWARPLGNDGVALINYSNLEDPIRQLSFFLNASTSVGVWYPVYTVGVQKQFFKMTVEDALSTDGKRELTFDRPLYFIQADNAFRLGHSWVIEAGYEFMSSMQQEIYTIVNPVHTLNVSVQKSFLKDDALTVRLSGSDLLNSSKRRIDVDYGSYLVEQKNDFRSPNITLRLSYRFNSASDKYKGTGAGADAKSRM